MWLSCIDDADCSLRVVINMYAREQPLHLPSSLSGEERAWVHAEATRLVRRTHRFKLLGEFISTKLDSSPYLLVLEMY